MAQHPEFLSGDIRTSLPPRARNLLEAAHRLLLQEGYEALTWSRIAQEAGEQKSIIAYYFGDKSTLVLTLLRAMGQDTAERLVAQCEVLPEGADRLHTFLFGLRTLHERPDSLAFYDVLPHALRDKRMRAEVAELYDWYRQMNLRVLGVDRSPFTNGDGDQNGGDIGASEAWLEQTAEASTLQTPRDPEYDAIAWLFMAAIDGIMIQEALRPSNYDSAAVYSGLERALLHLIESRKKE